VTALPKRIWVAGACGSGKSTLATKLAPLLGVEPTHLDEIHWRPGWVEGPSEVTDRRIREVAERPSWVIDGNYGRHRGAHIDTIDLLVWLDLPLRTVMPRLVRRCLVRAVRRQPVCNGNYEGLRHSFLSRDSLLLWELNEHQRRKREINENFHGRPHVRLRSQRDVDRWMQEVGATAGA